jgi:hypothetical protein
MTTAEQAEPRGSGDLIMEVLAARLRLGEWCWTFKTEHRPAARRLVNRGLIDMWSGVVENTFRATLTPAGRAMYLSDTYQLPERVNG